MKNIRQSAFVIWILIVQFGYTYCQECQTQGSPGYDVDECVRDTPCVANLVIPSPGNCEKYYVCSSGIWIEQPCPTSMSFSNVTYKCCVGSDPNECSEECPPTSPTPEPPHELCASTPPDCEEGDRAPDQNHCDYYFECHFALWQSRTCALGTAFDPVSLECIEDVAEANCEYRCLTSAGPTTLAPTAPWTSETVRTFVTVIETAAMTSDPDATEPWAFNGTGIFVTEVVGHTTETSRTTSTVPTTESSTVTTSTVTTPKWSRTTTTIRDTTESNPLEQDNTQMIIIIGSVCGAVGAILLVVLAILAQSGVIRCDIKQSKSTPNLPDGIMGPRYFPSSKSSAASSPASRHRHVSPYSNAGYHRHSVFGDNKAALFGFTHVDVISEKSAEYALESIKSQKTRTTGSRTTGSRTPGSRTPGTRTPGSRTPGMRTPGSKTPGSITPRPDDAQDPSSHEGHRFHKKKRMSQGEKFADEINKTLALYDVASVCSEASSERDSAYEESIPTPKGPVLPISGTIDV